MLPLCAGSGPPLTRALAGGALQALPMLLQAGGLGGPAAAQRGLPLLTSWLQARHHGGHGHGHGGHHNHPEFAAILEEAPEKFKGEAKKRLRVGRKSNHAVVVIMINR